MVQIILYFLKVRYNTRNIRRKSKKFKSEINEIVKGRDKSEDQKCAIKDIKTFYESRVKVIKLFNDYSKITSMTKYEVKYGKGHSLDLAA